jgi:single-stranded-DNA-specific exonuclease
LHACWSVRSETASTAPPTPESPGGSSLVARVLASRGLSDPAQAEAFLNPSLLGLHDPSLLPDADRAAERILGAIDAREPVVIYGDYDVDGVTATAILWHTLKELLPDADVRTYVPHRLGEGYGLNNEAIETLARAGAGLIVSVDCGITAVEQALLAKRLGVDLIITDHHNPPTNAADMPETYAVVHPRVPGSEYPFGDLCGAGVAYKLAWRLITMSEGSTRVSPRLRELLLHLLALAALGSIADVVPLVGENRIITRFGLGRLKRSPIAGLRALIDASSLDGADIDAERVAFTLAPRLNACGRLGHAGDVVGMLTEASYEEAFAIADELNGKNAARRKIEERIVEEAIELAVAEGMTSPDRRAIVLAKEGWHTGVVGIACSRLTENFCRPTILLDDDGEFCQGSGRSVRGVNLHAALEGCSQLLERWGGHDMAAGMSLRRENLGAFQEALIGQINSVLGAGDLVRRMGYDCEAGLEELSIASVTELAAMGPFGAGNPAIRLRLNGLTIAETPRQVGKQGKHLQIRFRGREPGQYLKCIAWRWGEHASELAAGMPVEILAKPTISRWGGSTSVEAEMHDLRICRPEH